MSAGSASEATSTATTSSRKIAWPELLVHRGSTIHGKRDTSERKISNELPPGPTTIPARKQVTGIPEDWSTPSTSSRLVRCLLTKPEDGTRPPR